MEQLSQVKRENPQRRRREESRNHSLEYQTHQGIHERVLQYDRMNADGLLAAVHGIFISNEDIDFLIENCEYLRTNVTRHSVYNDEGEAIHFQVMKGFFQEVILTEKRKLELEQQSNDIILEASKEFIEEFETTYGTDHDVDLCSPLKGRNKMTEEEKETCDQVAKIMRKQCFSKAKQIAEDPNLYKYFGMELSLWRHLKEEQTGEVDVKNLLFDQIEYFKIGLAIDNQGYDEDLVDQLITAIKQRVIFLNDSLKRKREELSGAVSGSSLPYTFKTVPSYNHFENFKDNLILRDRIQKTTKQGPKVPSVVETEKITEKEEEIEEEPAQDLEEQDNRRTRPEENGQQEQSEWEKNASVNDRLERWHEERKEERRKNTKSINQGEPTTQNNLDSQKQEDTVTSVSELTKNQSELEGEVRNLKGHIQNIEIRLQQGEINSQMYVDKLMNEISTKDEQIRTLQQITKSNDSKHTQQQSSMVGEMTDALYNIKNFQDSTVQNLASINSELLQSQSKMANHENVINFINDKVNATHMVLHTSQNQSNFQGEWDNPSKPNEESNGLQPIQDKLNNLNINEKYIAPSGGGTNLGVGNQGGVQDKVSKQQSTHHQNEMNDNMNAYKKDNINSENTNNESTTDSSIPEPKTDKVIDEKDDVTLETKVWTQTAYVSAKSDLTNYTASKRWYTVQVLPYFGGGMTDSYLLVMENLDTHLMTAMDQLPSKKFDKGYTAINSYVKMNLNKAHMDILLKLEMFHHLGELHKVKHDSSMQNVAWIQATVRPTENIKGKIFITKRFGKNQFHKRSKADEATHQKEVEALRKQQNQEVTMVVAITNSWTLSAPLLRRQGFTIMEKEQAQEQRERIAKKQAKAEEAQKEKILKKKKEEEDLQLLKDEQQEQKKKKEESAEALRVKLENARKLLEENNEEHITMSRNTFFRKPDKADFK